MAVPRANFAAAWHGASVDAADAVELLSVTCDEPYTLIGPLAGGETGATAVSGPRGQKLVLKWETDPERRIRRIDGVRLAERLRTEAGWPVPRQEVIEHDDLLFVTQEFLAGEPVTDLGRPLVDDLLALHEGRLGLAKPGDPDRWTEDLIETLVLGGNGYCLHEPLRRYDPRTRRLVERIEEIGRSLRPDDLAGTDVVHHDLHAGNILHTDGRLTAIIDLDFAQVGDAGFDLATLAVSSLETASDPEVQDDLFASVDGLGTERKSAYLAHLLLRILDWPIRRGRTEDVEFWLGHAARLLPEL